MAISRERLEELIEQGATIYATGFGEIELIPENDIEIYENGDSYIIYIFEPNRKYKNEIFAEELFETKEEAEWVLNMHTYRTEYFEPPFELKDNEKYKFKTANGGKMSISKFVYKSGEVQWWLSYVGTHRTFYSYPEAVEYARKLFLGEE